MSRFFFKVNFYLLTQDTDVARTPRSPLAEKYQGDSNSNVPPLRENSNFLSPKTLPPVNFHSRLLSPKVLPPIRNHSGWLGPQPSTYLDSEDENESVSSAPEGFYAHFSDTFEDDDSGSYDSYLWKKSKNQDFDEEVLSTHKPAVTTCRRPLVRGNSKENLRINVALNVTHNVSKFVDSTSDRNPLSGPCIYDQEQNGLPDSRVCHCSL